MSVRKFHVWPSSYEPPKDTDLLSELDRQMNAILGQRHLADDVKMKLYSSTLRRWLATNDAKKDKPMLVEEIAGPPPPPPAAPEGRATDAPPGREVSPPPAALPLLAATSPADEVTPVRAASPVAPASAASSQTSVRTARAPSPNESPPIVPRKVKKHTSRKNYAVAALDQSLKRAIRWDADGRIEVGAYAVPNTDINKIVDYLTEVQPNIHAPEGTELVIESLAINKVNPELIINRTERKKLGDMIGTRATPRRTRSQTVFEEQP